MFKSIVAVFMLTTAASAQGHGPMGDLNFTMPEVLNFTHPDVLNLTLPEFLNSTFPSDFNFTLPLDLNFTFPDFDDDQLFNCSGPFNLTDDYLDDMFDIFFDQDMPDFFDLPDDNWTYQDIKNITFPAENITNIINQLNDVIDGFFGQLNNATNGSLGWELPRFGNGSCWGDLLNFADEDSINRVMHKRQAEGRCFQKNQGKQDKDLKDLIKKFEKEASTNETPKVKRSAEESSSLADDDDDDDDSLSSIDDGVTYLNSESQELDLSEETALESLISKINDENKPKEAHTFKRND